MKTSSRQTFINVHRDAWVEINLENIAYNVKALKKLVKPHVKMLAVVKADAYGHGAAMAAPTMLASGVDMLGVASIDEGLDLRNANINCDILTLGAVPVWAFENAAENDISLSIFSEEHITACKQAFERTGIKIKAYVKLDTGMNRIGVGEADATEFIKKVQNSDCIDFKGIFSHLALAEIEEKGITEEEFIANNPQLKKIEKHVDKNANANVVNGTYLTQQQYKILKGILPKGSL